MVKIDHYRHAISPQIVAQRLYLRAEGIAFPSVADKNEGFGHGVGWRWGERGRDGVSLIGNA